MSREPANDNVSGAKMDLLRAYIDLKVACQKACTSRQPSGIGGTWTPDGEEDNGDLIHRTYAGGYVRTLFSRKFGFEIVEGYTNANGSEVHMGRGTESDVRAALDFYGAKWLTPNVGKCNEETENENV